MDSEQSTISYRLTMNQSPTYKNMQNEPNFTTKAPTKQENAANFIPIFSKKNTNFSKIIQKKPKISKKNAFCNFWTLTHLTLCTPKTYIKLLSQNTLQKRSLKAVFFAGKNAKRTQSIYSSTNLPRNVIPACRDPFTFLCKTNPIQILTYVIRDTKKMQNEPNLSYTHLLINPFTFYAKRTQIGGLR